MGGRARARDVTFTRRAAALIAVSLCILLAVPVVASAVPAGAPFQFNQLQVRHGDDDGDEHDHDQASHGNHDHHHHHDDNEADNSHEDDHTHHDMMDMAAGPSASSASAPISSSSAISSEPAGHHDMSEPHGPPPDHHHHSHGSHAAAIVELNDAEIHYWHSFPPSYLSADFRLTNDSVIFGEELPPDWDPENASGHKGLMVLHVMLMCMAYFAVLPIALALRAADHASHYIVNAAFLAVTALGWLAGVAYKAGSVDRYEGQVHGGLGNLLVLLSMALAGLDSLGLIKRAVEWYRRPEPSWSTFVDHVLRSDDHWAFREGAAGASRYEMVGLVDREQRYSADEPAPPSRRSSRVVFSIGDEDDEGDEIDRISPTIPGSHPMESGRRPGLPGGRYSPHERHSVGSNGSDGTLHDLPSPGTGSSSQGSFPKKPRVPQVGQFDAVVGDVDDSAIVDQDYEFATPKQAKRMTLLRFLEICLTWVRRTQVVIAYTAVITGLSVYTGMCRGSFVHSCAAHYIKGSIFFGYGVLTFARYLGAYADIGWAWNRRPAGVNAVSAEMVECAVIFTYGITNTWMERFGSAPGEPYSVKQVQHISIAVMFWFAGLSGMLLESKRVRKILASAVTGGRRNAVEPPSYAFSFNPLPALVIAVTGLAMAAHHQDYVFQVEIHSLWGTLLAGGSAFRFLTYFYLWLRPPTESEMPSRPPTEVLTAFGWAAGGIVFILSDEEISFAAMRAGYDDMMAFLNVTVALTCLVFCWEVVVMAVKGVAVLRLAKEKRAALGEGDEERRQPRLAL